VSDKKLTRSTEDRMIAGVAAGLADYFNMDPVLMRIIFVILTLMGGPGLILYIILWIVMPEG
jgi:phage shock protein C